MTLSIKNGGYAFLIKLDLKFTMSLWKEIQLLHILNNLSLRHLTLFRMDGEGRGWQKAPSPTSSLPVTSTNVGISHHSFLTFIFNILPHWCKISSLYLVPVPNYWTWTWTTLQNKRFFLPNPNKNEVLITSFIEMI